MSDNDNNSTEVIIEAISNLTEQSAMITQQEALATMPAELRRAFTEEDDFIRTAIIEKINKESLDASNGFLLMLKSVNGGFGVDLMYEIENNGRFESPDVFHNYIFRNMTEAKSILIGFFGNAKEKGNFLKKDEANILLMEEFIASKKDYEAVAILDALIEVQYNFKSIDNSDMEAQINNEE